MEAMKKLHIGEQDKSLAVCSSLNPCAVVSANPLLLPAAERSDGTTGPDEKTTVQGGLYPQLPSTLPKLCPLHKQVLEFYCRDDKEIVCDECSLIEHKGHRVVNPDEEMEVIANILCCCTFYLFIMPFFIVIYFFTKHLFKPHLLRYPFGIVS